MLGRLEMSKMDLTFLKLKVWGLKFFKLKTLYLTVVNTVDFGTQNLNKFYPKTMALETQMTLF